MPCKQCGLELLQEFDAEINLHIPGGESRDIAPVLIFPSLLVCLECGFTELVIPPDELSRLLPSSGLTV